MTDTLQLLSDDDLDKLANDDIEGMSDAGLRILEMGEQREPSFFQKAGTFLGRNLQLPGSVAGGLAGAATGSAFGPVGAVVGGIAGSATGAFGGSLASDVYEQERLDFDAAVKEAGVSVVFDAATLGAGRLLRPVASTLNSNVGDLLMNVTGRGRAAPSPSLTSLPTDVAAGSQDSLRLTQQLLEEGGGSLSAVQTGQASWLRATSEEIGEIGLFSGGRAKARVEANNAVLARETQRLVDGIDPSLARTAGEVGEEIFGIVEQGRKAAGQLYATGLDDIIQEFGDKMINPSRFRTAFRQFEKEHTGELTSLMTPRTAQFVAQLNEMFDIPRGPHLSVKGLFEVDKVISREIDQLMPGNQFADAVSVRQLSELRTRLRAASEATLAKQAKGAGEAYKTLKETYGSAMEDLLPKLSQSAVRAAEAGDFDRLGNLLIKQTNVSKIKAFMTSIDRAYADIAKAGKEFTPAVSSAARAKALVRQSFIRQIFQDVQGTGTDFRNLRNLAYRLNHKESQARARAIMGNQYGAYRRLVNAISDSTVDGKRGLFNLAVRSQEINAASKAGQLVGAGFGFGTGAVVGLPMAAAILTVPSVLARIATNNRAVNRLIALNGTVKRDPNISPELIVSGLVKVFNELDAEEREALQRDLGRPLGN